jgi:glycosyltransferase involved in cell wall biosynthesis
LPGHFGLPALIQLSRALNRARGEKVLIQYVPHAFGFKAMNLAFCFWLYERRRRGTQVMFHEVAFPLRRGQSAKHLLLAAATHIMAILVARSASRIFVSTLEWERVLQKRIGVRVPIECLPIPNSVPIIVDPIGVASLRGRYTANGGPLIGHFGTYGELVAKPLTDVMASILSEHKKLNVILIGTNGVRFRCDFIRDHAEFSVRVHAAGTLDAEELSRALSACDLMLQPYPDGVTTRRGTMMAALAHARAVVTTKGSHTEPVWTESRAVAIAPEHDLRAICTLVGRLLHDETARIKHARAGYKLYERHFALAHTIAALRAP